VDVNLQKWGDVHITKEDHFVIEHSPISDSMVPCHIEKDLAVLEVAPKAPTPLHTQLFVNNPDCDFYMVTHDEAHPDALSFNQGWTWAQNRNDLACRVPRKYLYYCFVDYDVDLRSVTGKPVLDELLSVLREWNPAVLVTHNIQSGVDPFDQQLIDKGNTVGPVLFSNNMIKIVHHSLIDYFFPMPAQFGGFWDCCTAFNILEAIPFPDRILCAYNVKSRSLVSSGYEQARNRAVGDAAMQSACEWMMGAVLPHARVPDGNNVFGIKEYYLDVRKKMLPERFPASVNHLDRRYLSRFFDLSHEHFRNLG
jgi:hypothetical protein